MRVLFGMLPDDPAFDPANTGWNVVQNSGKGRFSRFAILSIASAVSFITAVAAWGTWVPNAWHGTFTQAYPLGSFFVCLVIVIIIHEFLHLVAHPFFGLSAQSVVGFWPKLMAPYVLFDGQMVRNRLLLVMLIPFLVLSVLPLLLAMLTGYSNANVALIAIINSSGSVWDIYRAIIVATCIPVGARVRAHSGDLWWHKPNESARNGSDSSHDIAAQ